MVEDDDFKSGWIFNRSEGLIEERVFVRNLTGQASSRIVLGMKVFPIGW